MIDILELGGSSVGGYQLIRCLGHGTHTAVYRATGSLGSIVRMTPFSRITSGTVPALRSFPTA